jgi:hypothetical protein
MRPWPTARQYHAARRRNRKVHPASALPPRIPSRVASQLPYPRARSELHYEQGFYWYATALIFASFLVYIFMPDTRRHSKIERLD